MKLYYLLENIILEAVNKSDIERAMDGRRIVSLNYNDESEPGGNGKRFVEIYCYGTSKAGNDIIRIYQVGGDTKTEQPQWKTLRVDRIDNFEVLGGTFDTPRPLFNPTGDESMDKIYKITQF